MRSPGTCISGGRLVKGGGQMVMSDQAKPGRRGGENPTLPGWRDRPRVCPRQFNGCQGNPPTTCAPTSVRSPPSRAHCCRTAARPPVLARVRPAVRVRVGYSLPALEKLPPGAVDPLGAEATEAGHVGVAGQEGYCWSGHGPAQDVRDAVGVRPAAGAQARGLS